MITKNMIDAGKRAYWSAYKAWNLEYSLECQITAIYEAMSDQKQKDALKEYRKNMMEELDKASEGYICS